MGGGVGTKYSRAGKGAVGLGMLSLAIAALVAKPTLPERPLAFPFIPGMAKWSTKVRV